VGARFRRRLLDERELVAELRKLLRINRHVPSLTEPFHLVNNLDQLYGKY